MIEGYYEKGFCYRSEKYKLIFVHVSKNATTSIKSIRAFDFVQDNILRYQKSELKKYTVFTVIRNPEKRFISAYLEVCSRASMDSLHIAKYPFYWCRDQEKRFKMFLDELEHGCFDVHLLPQHYFLTDQCNNMFEFDYILNLENLDDEFKKMQCDLGIYPILELPRKNSSIEKNKSKAALFISKINRLPERKGGGNRGSAIPLGYMMLDMVYRFMIRRKVASYKTIESIINSNLGIRARIEAFLDQDIRFYNKLINKG